MILQRRKDKDMKAKLEMLKVLAAAVAEVTWFLAGPAPEGYATECWDRK